MEKESLVMCNAKELIELIVRDDEKRERAGKIGSQKKVDEYLLLNVIRQDKGDAFAIFMRMEMNAWR